MGKTKTRMDSKMGCQIMAAWRYSPEEVFRARTGLLVEQIKKDALEKQRKTIDDQIDEVNDEIKRLQRILRQK
jgi:hypothetical protein